MKTRFEKITRIASELMSYCHHYGARKFSLEILEDEASVSLSICASPELIPELRFDFLKNALNAPRQRDVEQDYWELIGESDDHFELTLLGMLCDESNVEYRDNVLCITLKKYD